MSYSVEFLTLNIKGRYYTRYIFDHVETYLFIKHNF